MYAATAARVARAAPRAVTGVPVCPRAHAHTHTLTAVYKHMTARTVKSVLPQLRQVERGTQCTIRFVSAGTAARVASRLPRSAARWMSTSAHTQTLTHTAAEGAAGAAGTAAKHASNRVIGYWLLTTAGMVFVMVVLGGVTRLTRSGLSIVEWRPQGETLPLSQEEWEVEFDKYKRFPEFQKVNRHMTLEEFKPIYWMEWFHRFWGRAIGVAFGLPLLYFAVARKFPPGVWPKVATLFTLGAAQGGVGWWMVKSGLEHERFNEYAIPRVSPYRLATHLGFAFTLYSMLVWFGLDQLRKPAVITEATAAAVRRLRIPVLLSTGVIATTVASGAFVAGNDAGHAYNDWPFMAGKFIPEEVWDSALGLRNIFENTATVQFDHRMLAYTSLGAVHGVWVASRKAGRENLPVPVRRGVVLLGGLVGLQAALGISTLMMYVPVSLGATHQAGALALLTGALSLAHWVKTYSTAAVASTTAAAATAAPAPVKASAMMLLPLLAALPASVRSDSAAE